MGSGASHKYDKEPAQFGKFWEQNKPKEDLSRCHIYKKAMDNRRRAIFNTMPRSFAKFKEANFEKCYYEEAPICFMIQNGDETEFVPCTQDVEFLKCKTCEKHGNCQSMYLHVLHKDSNGKQVFHDGKSVLRLQTVEDHLMSNPRCYYQFIKFHRSITGLNYGHNQKSYSRLTRSDGKWRNSGYYATVDEITSDSLDSRHKKWHQSRKDLSIAGEKRKSRKEKPTSNFGCKSYPEMDFYANDSPHDRKKARDKKKKEEKLRRKLEKEAELRAKKEKEAKQLEGVEFLN